MQRAGKLTARAHFAVLITPPQGRDPAAGGRDRSRPLAQRYDQGEIEPQPALTVRNVKLFLDGVITAPALHRRHADALFEPAGRARQSALGALAEPRTGGVFPGTRA